MRSGVGAIQRHKRLWWNCWLVEEPGAPRWLRVLSATAILAMVEKEMAATGWAGWAVRLFSLALLADTPVFSSEIDAP